MHLQNDSTNYKFCPHCSGALEQRFIKPTEPMRLVCIKCDFIFYLDPKLAVGTIIANEENHILLIRRAIEPGYGKWVFPGGYVDRGEETIAAAIRETREECGLKIQIKRLVNIYSYAGSVPVIIVYEASVIEGHLACDDEGLEVQFFPPSKIPWNNLAFKSTREALHEFLKI